jgi:hypothetical protein
MRLNYFEEMTKVLDGHIASIPSHFKRPPRDDVERLPVTYFSTLDPEWLLKRWNLQNH